MSDFNEILTDLKRKIYKPVYFLCGEEPYFIDQISDFIESTVLDESEKEFNQTVLYGRDVDLATVIGAVKRYPMMSEYQVVVVKEAQNIREFSKGGSEEGETKSGGNTMFQSYVEHPQTSTILVICHKYKTIDKRTALAKTIQKKSVFFESKKLYDNQVPEWVTSYLKNKGYKINPKASLLLAEFLGNDLSKIANELDKLTINISADTEISADHIQENIGISKDYNIFELQDALGKKDVLRSNRIINYFAANPKDNPLVVTLGVLYGYFSKILVYHFTPDKNKFNISKALGVNPYFVEGYERAAKNYNTAKLKSVFGYLREYDLRSKGIDNPSVGDGELLKELVFKILH
ncbi:MAG: DNA polymerase III subunit delta [Bacteroidia bacterium]